MHLSTPNFLISNRCFLLNVLLYFISNGLLAQPKMLTNLDEDKCYGKASPAIEYKFETKKIEVRKAYEEFKATPLEYDTVTSRILVKSHKIDFNPYKADYNLVKETITTKEEGRLFKEVYNMVENPRIKRSSFIGWHVKSNCGMPECNDVILQWLELATLFDTLEVPELDKINIQTKVKPIYKTIYRIQPKEHTLIDANNLPGEYITITQYLVKQHAKEQTFKYPSKYNQVEKKVPLNSNEIEEWVEVLCPDNLNGLFLGQLQLALKKEKYQVGRINGVWNKMCQTALETYQRQNTLPIGQFDKMTIQALGLNYDILTSSESKKETKQYNDIFEH